MLATRRRPSTTKAPERLGGRKWEALVFCATALHVERMAPDPLFDRLRDALLPDYRLERELGRGGMGIVFLATDLTLNCPVAVKVLRLELDTAHTAAAFVREAQLMARVRHPNVVSIHHAYSTAGLHYYIMEYIAGPTLEQRLESGPLKRGGAVKFGRDLLDGLESVHDAGVVHRDIKPSNVFLVGNPIRAKLADFGIARAPSPAPRPPHGRAEGSGEGTPGYMAPEQIIGDPVTPRTDLHSAGAVLYEAITAQRFPPYFEHASWKRVPWLVARVLRRATQLDPAARWPDAREFRRALWRTRIIPYLVRAAMLAIGGIIVGAAVVLAIAVWQRGQMRPGALSVALPRCDYTGPAAQRPIADSLVEMVRAELSGHPDFRVTASRSWFLGLFRSSPALIVRCRLAITNGDVQVQLADVRLRGNGTAIPDVRIPLAAWPTLRDSLAYRVLLAVWDAESPLARSLPVTALPRTPLGLVRFLDAERLVAAGEWGNAYDAYALAEATDPTCWLCSWRLNEVERWLSREHDPARVRRYLSHVQTFPAWYQSLIRAQQLPLEARLDTLRAETTRWPDFFLGWFQLGDELFHRGPLAGHARAEAIPAFERAARLRPDFAPAWEHLAWVNIAEGDSGGAERGLQSFDRNKLQDDAYALTLRRLLHVAFAWRFLPEAVALARTVEGVNDRVAGAFADLAAGPRMLASFDAPRGEVAFGAMLERRPGRDLQRSGLIAQSLGSLALGQPSRAVGFAHRAAELSAEPELARFAAQLEATIAVLDPAAGTSREPRARLPAVASGDPFSRTIAHMRVAAQRSASGDTDGARRALLWHEHTDVMGLPTGLPQAAEVDWAFGTLARWRLGALLAAHGERADACKAYRDVVRLWGEGEPLYRARADTARRRVRELHCP